MSIAFASRTVVRNSWWIAAGLMAAVAIGRVSASPSGHALSIALLLFAIPAAGLIASRPSSSLWVGVCVPFCISLVSTSSLLVLGAGVLGWGIALTWRSATAYQRRVASTLMLLGVLVSVNGMFITPRSESSAQLAVGVIYSCLVGANACLTQPSEKILRMFVAIIGALAALLALASPQVAGDRTYAVWGENSNGIGLMCAIGLVASLASIFSIAEWGPQLLGWFSTGLLCAKGVWDSGSRGALLAVIGGILAIIVARYVSRGRRQAVTALLVLSAILLAVAGQILQAFVGATGREAVGAGGNITTRQESLAYAVNAGIQHPVFGVGLGRLNVVSQEDVASRLGLRAHNVYAGILAESGVIAFLALTFLIVLALNGARISSATSFLPLVVAVFLGGISLEWWGTTRLGVIAMLIIGFAGAKRRPVEEISARENYGYPP